MSRTAAGPATRPNLLFIMSDDHAGLDVPDEMQGTSLAPLLAGERPDGWQQSMYYRYWMHDDGAHRVPAHYGVRTRTHKLIGYYNDPLDQPGARGPAVEPEWELFDLVADPAELHNVIARAGLPRCCDRAANRAGPTPGGGRRRATSRRRGRADGAPRRFGHPTRLSR